MISLIILPFEIINESLKARQLFFIVYLAERAMLSRFKRFPEEEENNDHFSLGRAKGAQKSHKVIQKLTFKNAPTID